MPIQHYSRRIRKHPRRVRLSVTVFVILATLVALAASGFTAPAPPAAAQDGPMPRGYETLALLEDTIIPARDRLDLAQRLLGVTKIDPPPINPPERALGDVMAFWVENSDDDRSFQVNAELVYKTDHVYMFVEVGEVVDLSGIQRAADTFEAIIRPRIHAVFGTEALPGVDGDPHLVVLHARDLGNRVAAYFYSNNQYPRAAVLTSNEAEMFVVNLDTMRASIGSDYYIGVLAHEFQHMVHWAADINEDIWINEGASELAVMLAGYGPSGFAPRFLNNPTIQLNTWPDAGDRGIHYGSSFLFMAYFYERYGEAATTALVRDPANGMESVNNTLASIGARDPVTLKRVDMVDLFADWTVANLLMDPTVSDGRYAYRAADLQSLTPAAVPFRLRADGTPLAERVNQWGTHYIEVPAGGAAQTVRLQFEGQETVQVVPVNAYSGNYMWWSNRADVSDSRLTRAFDLSGVDRATLSFWTWYDIENLWDYGYVMVSVDDGATWTPLETNRTTRENPHGNSYGPAYTGSSGGWVQEVIDLSPYAGQPVLLRFEHITDDAVNLPGMVIDDVSIPEIGYFDDFESGDGGWQAEGWVYMDNVLPQFYSVQVVQPDSVTQSVTRLLDWGESPAGEWEFTLGGDAGDAVIVISGLTPFTTEAAPYTITLTPAG